MKRILNIFLTSVAVLSLSIGANAATLFSDAAASKPHASITAKAAARAGKAVTQLSQASLPQATATTKRAVKRQALSKTIAASDFKTSNIQVDYTTGGVFSSTSADTLKLNGDTLTLTNFYRRGAVKAHVDLETGALTIARQVIYTSSTYGDCDLVHVNDAMTSMDTTAVITGSVKDGVVTLGHWALRIKSGTYQNYILGSVNESSTIKPSNAVMNVVEVDSTGAKTNYSYPVFAEQSSTNIVDVYNFGGFSSKINVQVKGDSTLGITPQQILTVNNVGVFFCYPYVSATKTYYMHKQITGTTASNKLAWGEWTVSASNGQYYLHNYTSADIQLPFTLSYPPAQTQAGFKGTGTEADPYLIETPADLLALSDSVNYNTVVPTGAKYGDAFTGKYFKQTKYINMAGIAFPPIGGDDDLYRFAGTYDGGSRTISNLTVNTGTKGYAGLFGSVDTVGTVQNVTLYKASVSSRNYYYTGAVAGHCMGKLSNISVSSSSVVGTYCTGGIAGYAGESTKCSFTGGTVVGDTQTGGVIGVIRSPASYLYATATTVTCTSTVATSSVGGVVGFLSNSKGGKLTDSYFSGDVVLTRMGEFGGCVLGVSVESPVERCFSTGRIYTTSAGYSTSAAGGIVGAIQASKISNCYFTGENLIASARSASIVGYAINVNLTGHADHSEFTNCYATGVSKSSSKTEYAPYLGTFDSSYGTVVPTVTGCYYDVQMLPLVTTKNGAKSTSFFTTGSAISNYSDSVWTFTAGLYPRLKNIATNAAAYVSAAPVVFSDTVQNVENVSSDFTAPVTNSVKWKVLKDGVLGTDGNGVSVDNSGAFHLNGSLSTDTIYALNGTTISKYCIIKCAPKSLFSGDGTEASPFLIKTKADLIKLSEATYTNNMSFTGSYFKIVNDIDVEGDSTFLGIGSIASATYAFGGILDGGNHTLHNIQLISCVKGADGNPTSRSRNRGFVTALKAGGVVENIVIAADCKVEAYASAAAVVGYNYGGSILNCRNFAPVFGHSGTVAGITSYNNTGGVIRGCYNAGKITGGYQYAAGIVGNNRGLVENCQNDGEICIEKLNEYYDSTRYNTAGGICHANFGTIKNVLNTGYVHANKYVGGIIAWFNGSAGDNMVTSALNVGMLSSNDIATTGNIVGKLYAAGVCDSAYYDNKINVYNDCFNKTVKGCKPTATDVLTSGNPIAGLDTAYWQFEKGKYPTLKAFATEAGSQAGALSVVDFTGSVRCDSIKRDSKLASATGLTWAVVNGKAFKVDGTNLSMDPADVLVDTLVATYKGYVKRIPIVAVPDSLPVPSIASASQGNKQAVVTDSIEGCTIYYTLDGSTPTTKSSSVMAGANFDLPVGEVTVSAIAAKHNYYNSQVATCSFLVTGVDDNLADKTVVGKSYVTPSGVTSLTPVDGVNIVITTYSDGTQSITKKVLRAK
jgi:hypothetical protein